MERRRSDADLDIYVGTQRAFEWYWTEAGKMPGLDAYEKLDLLDRAAVLASFEHWGTARPGERPLESRVNEEHRDPLIVAVKSDTHRFPAFHAGNDIWIVTGHYRKAGRKLDKVGEREIRRAIKARRDYFNLVEEGRYYGRG